MEKLTKEEVAVFKVLKDEFSEEVEESVFVEPKPGVLSSPWIEHGDLEAIVSSAFPNIDLNKIDLEELILHVRDVSGLPKLILFYSEIVSEGEDAEFVEGVKSEIDRIQDFIDNLQD